MDNKELIRLAGEARRASYSPYSGYAVGAALLCEDGEVYLGCNIENAAFSPTNCAERTAFFEGMGLKVIRYSNRDIDFAFSAVCENIDQIIKERSHD